MSCTQYTSEQLRQYKTLTGKSLCTKDLCKDTPIVRKKRNQTWESETHAMHVSRGVSGLTMNAFHQAKHRAHKAYSSRTNPATPSVFPQAAAAQRQSTALVQRRQPIVIDDDDDDTVTITSPFQSPSPFRDFSQNVITSDELLYRYVLTANARKTLLLVNSMLNTIGGDGGRPLSLSQDLGIPSWQQRQTARDITIRILDFGTRTRATAAQRLCVGVASTLLEMPQAVHEIFNRDSEEGVIRAGELIIKETLGHDKQLFTHLRNNTAYAYDVAEAYFSSNDGSGGAGPSVATPVSAATATGASAPGASAVVPFAGGTHKSHMLSSAALRYILLVNAALHRLGRPTHNIDAKFDHPDHAGSLVSYSQVWREYDILAQSDPALRAVMQSMESRGLVSSGGMTMELMSSAGMTEVLNETVEEVNTSLGGAV